MRRELLASVASTALVAYSPSLHGQTPTLGDVYKMVLELKANQAELRNETEEAKKEAADSRKAYHGVVEQLIDARQKLRSAEVMLKN
jgi:hypothetical protein